ncbi:MAG: molybdenum cofactor guanylyltransferase [Rudaea sp.]|uniref:molybdenum cofactor guanylyltransferase MobA n=1 Tax=unclassified Rudaea TaxID=2627037 RepID=UPI0010F618AE|nr:MULTISPECIES: molybdenum cofactor guanylyltransferase MobA [unclassified Rudaea]MBN8888157.1 molybdenum cofactor guanylyltransferase [Rudaea sp.]MBR0344231.1 molybdenum cofactor guanylyltransferase [Rudaea sp.]
MRSRADITAAILAGGEGRRVGGNDKGLLELAGRPLVAHVAAALHGQAGSIFVCANRHAHEYAHFGTVIADTQPGFQGPLAGIAAALERCQTDWMLTVPVDAPNPPRDLTERLLAAADAAQADAAVAHDGMRRQPLFALYRTRLIKDAAEVLAVDPSVHGWQDLIGAVEVDFSDRASSFANLNTLDELREWEKHHAG